MAETEPDTQDERMTDAASGQEEVSHDGSTSSESEDEPVLAVTRERRANAGNRMSRLLALAEEEDAQQEEEYGEIFAETADDGDFEEKEIEEGEQNMDESSEEEDEGAAQDEGAEEKELREQERRENPRKRKRLVLHETAVKRAALRAGPKPLHGGETASPTPGTNIPPSRRKSERASWLPQSSGQGATRASSRKSAVESRATTQNRLVKKEQQRLVTVANMEAADKRREANKPKKLTQEARLAEAARVERMNSKSLNRWEAAERRRVEEQKARLAALKEHRLEGPIITYYSGPALYINDRLRAVGKNALVREVAEKDATPEPEKDATPVPEKDATPVPEKDATPVSEKKTAPALSGKGATLEPENDKGLAPKEELTAPEKESTLAAESVDGASSKHVDDPGSKELAPSPQTTTGPPSSIASVQQLAPSSIGSTVDGSGGQSVSRATGEQQEGSKEGFLSGIEAFANSAPEPQQSTPSSQLFRNSPHATSSQATSTDVNLPAPETSPTHSLEQQTPAQAPGHHTSETLLAHFQKDPGASFQNTFSIERQSLPKMPLQPTQPKVPPKRELAARVFITLLDFPGQENASRSKKDPDFIRRSLLGWSASASLAPTARGHARRPSVQAQQKKQVCAVTGQPARYLDPETGLYFLDAVALRSLRWVIGSKAKWSSLMGTFAHPIDSSAKGRPAKQVPDWFLMNGDALAKRRAEVGVVKLERDQREEKERQWQEEQKRLKMEEQEKARKEADARMQARMQASAITMKADPVYPYQPQIQIQMQVTPPAPPQAQSQVPATTQVPDITAGSAHAQPTGAGAAP